MTQTRMQITAIAFDRKVPNSSSLRFRGVISSVCIRHESTNETDVTSAVLSGVWGVLNILSVICEKPKNDFRTFVNEILGAKLEII